MRLRQLSSTLRTKSTQRKCFLFATFLIGTLSLVSLTTTGKVDARRAPEFSANIPSQMSANMATSPKHTLIDPIKDYPTKKGKKPGAKATATPDVTPTPYQDTPTATTAPQSGPAVTPTPGNASVHGATTTPEQPPMVPKLPQTGSDPGSHSLP